MFSRISILLIFSIVFIFANDDLFKPRIYQHLLFRIESFFTFGGKIQVINLSSKQVIAELRNKFSLLKHQANFTILDPISNQWINGEFQRQFHFYKTKYLIHWNKQSILIENKVLTYTTTFTHEQTNQTLAIVKEHAFSL
ncbi:hypothetical protein I4U23_017408 [Adineta vaga]|nr:hypothetical protein I4U23_017408 [Adineta vaga]